MKSSFKERVLFLVAEIPRGKLTTYDALAVKLKSSPRAVGQALGANQQPIIIPCHRVVRADGSLGGYVGGVEKKVELLEKEGIEIKGNKIVGFNNYLFSLKKIIFLNHEA